MRRTAVTIALAVAFTTASLAADVLPPGWIEYTVANSASANDNNQVDLTMPFAFSFYGGAFSSDALRVNANGYLGLGTSTYNYDDPPSWPAYSYNENYTRWLAAMWHNLNPSGATAGQLYYQTVGSTGNRLFVVTWDTWADSAHTQENIFQIQLHEQTGDISYHYYALDSVEGSRVGVNHGDGVEYTGFWYDGSANTDGSGTYNANQDGPDGSLEGWRIAYSYDPQSGSYSGDATYAPEPGTMALMLVGIGGVLAARRRRSG